ncbi:hypothetical protein BTJ40_09360 [Microbulbifer sp. A4B17]|nr:hypothetical protein BTJ40_09360 [Microbulbifer sp. A4B17]
MNKAFFLLLAMFLSAPCFSEKIRLKPYDCGPLARGELGVVFSTGELGNGQTYFVNGKASDLCPQLMSEKSVSGYEPNYCANYEPVNREECGVIKIFTITRYQHAPDT